MVKHTPKQIRERREKIMILMAHGYYLQGDIADKLGVSRKTVNSDMHYINEMNQKKLYDMAKSSFSTLYTNCNDGMNALLNECWRTYKNEDNNPEITYAIRMAALKLASDIYDKKMNMFKDGPATFQLKSLYDKVEELRRGTLGLSDENVFTQRYQPSSHTNTNISKEGPSLNLDDLGKP